MLKFRLFGIPVVIDWWFWLSAVLLGGGMSARGPEDWRRIAVWTVVMFISILAHEMGHALAGRRFGLRPGIRLHGFGGLTYLPGAHLSKGQNIFVSAAGPAAGLLLGLLVVSLATLTPVRPGLATYAYEAARHINFFWTAINLLPIQPLDGGQILREILGPRRLRITAIIGGVLAVLLGLWSLRAGQLYMALIMALFAYHNFRQDEVEGGVVKG